MEGIKRGVDRRFTVISKLRDPDSYGAERVALYDVSFDDLTLADWQRRRGLGDRPLHLQRLRIPGSD